MFMYLWKNWDLIGILSFEIGIWSLGFENKKFEILK